MKRMESAPMLPLLICSLLSLGLASEAGGQVHFQALAERIRLYPAEPFRVTLVLTNRGDQPIEVSPFDPGLKGAIAVRPPLGHWKEFRPFLGGAASAPHRILTIAPQQSYRAGLRLDIASGCSGGGFVMTQAGIWSFIFTIHLETPSQSVSSSLTVEVLPPPPQEEAALEAFRQIPGICAIMFYLHADAPIDGSEAKEQLETFASRYGGTLYADYAWFCIARSMLPIPEFGERLYGREKPAEALPIFLRLSALPPERFSLVADSLYYSAACYHWLADREKAERLLEDVLSRFPDATLLERAKNALQTLKSE